MRTFLLAGLALAAPSPQSAPQPCPRPLVYVAMAAHELAPGEVIERDDLFVMQAEPRYVPSDVLREPDELVGRVVTDRILQHEFFREARFAPVDRGLWTLTVPHDPTALAAGNHVEIVGTSVTARILRIDGDRIELALRPEHVRHVRPPLRLALLRDADVTYVEAHGPLAERTWSPELTSAPISSAPSRSDVPF